MEFILLLFRWGGICIQHNNNQKTRIINQLKLYANTPNIRSIVVQRSNLKKMNHDFHFSTLNYFLEKNFIHQLLYLFRK